MAIQDVISSAPGDGVVPGATEVFVHASARGKNIILALPAQRIVAGDGRDRIVPAAAIQRIVSEPTFDQVAAQAA